MLNGQVSQLTPAAPAGSNNPQQAKKDHSRFGRTSDKTLHFALAYVDSEDAMKAAAAMSKPDNHEDDIRILIESPVLWESVRPFLEALQKTDTLRMPMADYIRHSDPLKLDISPPAYALEPGFKWDLTVLLKDHADGWETGENLIMDPKDPHSVEMARERLAVDGKLDPRSVKAEYGR